MCIILVYVYYTEVGEEYFCLYNLTVISIILLFVDFLLDSLLIFFFLSQVHLQTQQQVTQRLSSMAVHVVRTQGVLALYNGLSASLMRQVSRYGHHNYY